MASVLVTGGGGFAGRHLIRELRREGHEQIAATVLGDPGAAVSGTREFTGVRWLTMDVLSDDSIAQTVRTVQPEVVFHLAGQASVGQSFGTPLSTWEINATGTLRLLTVLARESPGTRRVLLTSSAEVYGAVPEAAQPVREDAAYHPVTPYGASKAAAEIAALQIGPSHGIEVVVARSFNHIGPGQDERFVLPSMARQLVQMMRGNAEPVLLVGNLAVNRDFLDVRDVARAYVRLLEAGEPGTAYNVCSGRAISLESLIRGLVELSGTRARIEVDPNRVRPADIPTMVGNPDRLRALGWEPGTMLEQSLADLLDEVREAG